MKRLAVIGAAVVLAPAGVPLTASGATEERDPFQRPAMKVEAASEAMPVELRFAGRVSAGRRALALLVAADGFGRIVEEGSVLPDLGLRVLRIGWQTVRLEQMSGGDELLVAAVPGGRAMLPAEEDR